MDLRIAGIGKKRSFFMYLPRCRGIGSHGIGGKEVYVSIASRSDYYGMGRMALDFTRYQVTGNNTACLAIYLYYVQHFVSVVHGYLATGDLSVHCGIGAQQ